MRVLGIDPGIRTTGFGIIDSNINRLSLIASGTINPKVSDNLPLRLNYLFEEVELIINKFSPDIFSIEDMFYSKNVKTAMILGQARGAMIIAAAQANIDIFEYAQESKNVCLWKWRCVKRTSSIYGYENFKFKRDTRYNRCFRCHRSRYLLFKPGSH